MNNRISNKNFQQNKDDKHLSHLMGLGLDCTDGHKRITQGDKFSILGGSDKTHDNMTETLYQNLRGFIKKRKNT